MNLRTKPGEDDDDDGDCEPTSPRRPPSNFAYASASAAAEASGDQDASNQENEFQTVKTKNQRVAVMENIN
jgi:hypothetical protein